MGKRGKKVKEETRRKVVELRKIYSVPYIAKHFGPSKSEIYKILRQERKRPLHFAELSKTALTLASNFHEYRNNINTVFYPTGKIGEWIYGGTVNEIASKWYVNMREVDKSVASNLLYHLKKEFPELADIDDWTKLARVKITEDFIQQLNLKAYRGEFNGRCKDCPK